jgi:predicted nucleic acid-binding protein
VPGPVATIDTSVLLSLQCADLLGAISVLFERVLVPRKVREELADGGPQNEPALAAIAEYALFEACDDYDASLVELLLQTRRLQRAGRDRGEAEAVIQSAQRSASTILMDDRLGRQWALTHGIECHGSIWICHELRRSGYLARLRPTYVALLRNRRRLPLAALNDYLRDVAEPPISTIQYRDLTASH